MSNNDEGTATTTFVITGNELSGIKPPSFDWEAPDLTKQFKTFRRYCELVLQTPTYAAKAPKEVVNFILLWMGPQAVEIFDNLKFDPVTDKEQPEKVWNAFLAYFEPKSNYRLARFQLRDYVQGQNEPIDTFVTRLKIQAQKCNFVDVAQTEDQLIDQIIKGTIHPNVRRKLLNQDPGKLTLDAVLEYARTYETTQTHLESFKDRSVSEIQRGDKRHNRDRSRARNNRFRNRSHGDSSQGQCSYCGGKPHPRDQCPAKEDTCHGCGKQGHWSKVCRTTSHPGNPGTRSQPRSRGRDKTPSSRGRYRHYDNKQQAPRQNKQGHGIHEFSGIQDVSDDFESLTFDTVDTKNNRTEAYAQVTTRINHKNATLKGKADTGAQGNVLPLRTYRNMFPNNLDKNQLPLGTKKSNVKLTAYNGTRIRQHGVITLPCRYRDGKWIKTDFFIADTPGPIIFGLQTCVDLHLVEMNCEVNLDNVDIIRSSEDLKGLYPDRFEGIGNFPGKHKLTLKPDAQPVIHAPRRAPIQLKDKIKAELNRMTELGVIRPVQQPTDWVSSITYVHKPDGSLRICLDPKDLNRNLKRAQHHTPTLEELTHRFSNAKVFSKLDAKSGYWSIALDEESQLLTTFNSPFGRYCFCRLPFGLSTSGDVFQAAMDKILDGLQGVVSIHDDITVYGEGNTIDEATKDHDSNLRNLMERARKHNLVFNFGKTNILQKEISFFGNIYGRDGVRPDPAKVQAVMDIRAPTDIKQLQSFLGMITYLAPYIPNLSEHTTHLRTLLKDKNEFQWNHEQECAFQKIKDIICSAKNLAYFDPKKPTVIKVDASQTALGAALTQDGKPVAYASKSLTDTESRYANIEREMLACVFGAERFHTYVYGEHFVIQSDHKPLEMITRKTLTAAPARLQRMLLRLQRYDYEIQYVPGRDMALPDSLSRLPKATSDPEINLDAKVCHVQFSTPKLNEIRSETDKDVQLAILKRFVTNGFPDSARDIPHQIKDFWAFRDQLSVDNGLILKGEQVIIPESLRTSYLERIHEAHQGITRCQQRARASVYWPGINRDIENLVTTCFTCQKYQRSQPKETLMPIIPEVPNIPWHTLGSDMFHVDGHDYIVIADYYSKFPVVERLQNLTSRVTADIMRKCFSLMGTPNTIISDNGGPYIGKEVQELMNELGIVHITSSPHHPKSHGFIESIVKTVKSLIRKSPKDTNTALLLHRTTPIGHNMPSPAELLFNRRISANLPVKITNTTQDTYQQKRAELQNQVETRYNQHASDLCELKPDQDIFYQDVAKRTWTPGKVIGVGPEPRSYTIQCALTGRMLRRNRQLIRPRQVTFNMQPSYQLYEPDDILSSNERVKHPETPQPASQSSEVPAPTVVPRIPNSPPISTTSGRPQRNRQIPAKLKDYILG